MTIGGDSQIGTILRAAQAGDQVAFAELYQRYGALVYRTAFLMLGDANRAEDLTQDVFLRLHRRLDQYNAERGAFTTWLYGITVNTCLNARRGRWLAWLSLDRARANGFDLPDERHQPIDLALRGEEQRQIWHAVQQLPLKLRAVVVLRYYHDLSYDELATVLRCPIGTVRSRLHAAHAQLRAALAEHRAE